MSRYEPLVSVLEPLEVAIDTLPSRSYMVVSFFGAMHAVLCHCLPPNQTLREYLEIFLLLTMLLSRTLKTYLITQTTNRTKINLLVCLSSDTSNKSFAVVGFSASAHPHVKRYIIGQRKHHLRLLERIKLHGLLWAVENCAEAETYAHMGSIMRQLLGAINDLHRMIAVTLTLDLTDQSTLGPCAQCSELIYKLRSQLSCAIFSLAPVRGINREQ